ncbi:unnamed protein product [Closterium sp. NIES-53]
MLISHTFSLPAFTLLSALLPILNAVPCSLASLPLPSLPVKAVAGRQGGSSRAAGEGIGGAAAAAAAAAGEAE